MRPSPLINVWAQRIHRKHGWVLSVGFPRSRSPASACQWLNNRSLWFDEAMLARNIIARNPFELLAPLDYAQAAPVLFLCLVKAATVLFGSGELALRFVPLCASIVGLVVFLLLAKQFLESRYVPIALFLITTSPILIYYSQELKQYSVDVAVTLSPTYSFFRLLKSDPPRKNPFDWPVRSWKRGHFYPSQCLYSGKHRDHSHRDEMLQTT